MKIINELFVSLLTVEEYNYMATSFLEHVRKVGQTDYLNCVLLMYPDKKCICDELRQLKNDCASSRYSLAGEAIEKEQIFTNLEEIIRKRFVDLFNDWVNQLDRIEYMIGILEIFDRTTDIEILEFVYQNQYPPEFSEIFSGMYGERRRFLGIKIHFRNFHTTYSPPNGGPVR